MRLAGLAEPLGVDRARISQTGCGLRLEPRALSLGYRLGSDTLLVLLDLAVHATESPEGIVVTASYRDVARRLGVSKDTVGRRMAVLRGVGVVVELSEDSVDRFETRSYRLYLDFAGVTRELPQVAAVSPGDGLYAGSGCGVVLSAECRLVRRSLRPLVWVILEEIVLARLSSTTVSSLRAPRPARSLNDSGSTRAPWRKRRRVLGRRGLVSLEREKGPAGRFGLSVYELRPPAGMTVVQPDAAELLMVSPSMVQPDTAGAVVLSPCVAASQVESSRLEAAAPGPPPQPGRTSGVGSVPGGRRSRRLRCHSRGRFGSSPGPLHGLARLFSALPGAEGAGSRISGPS